MKKISLCLVAFVVTSMPAPSAWSQGTDLAAVARKEKERRAKITTPVKVLTEDDGKAAAAKGAGSITTMGAESSTPTPAATPGDGKPPAATPEAQQAAWKARGDAARAAVVAAQKDLDQMERDAAALRSDLAPLSAQEAQDPMRLQKRDQRMVALQSQIEKQRAALSAAKKAVSDLEDEARKSGVPAGWLR